VVLFGAPAASAQTLQDRFRLKPPVAHYVVLLDTSGSMKPYFTTVTGALRQFLASLRAPDTIAVLRFDTTWIRLCAGPAGQVDLSTCVPDRVEFGKYTDIGAALQQGIAELQRSAAEILVLLFLTDGRHDPPPFSKYPGLVGPAWTDLERQGNELARRREVLGFAIGLQRYADVALLRRALPPDRTEVVSLAGPGLLQSRLDEIRMRIQRRRLAFAVREELKKGGVTIARAGEPRLVDERLVVPYTVTSQYVHLPVRFRLDRIEGHPAARASIAAGPPAALQPGKTVSFDVGLPAPTFKRWRVGKAVERWAVQLVFHPEVGFLDAQEIRTLGIEPSVRVGGTTQSVAFAQQVGISLLFLAGLPLSALLLALGGRRWLSVPAPSVYGILQISSVGDAREEKRYRLDEFGKASVKVGGQEGDIPVREVLAPRTEQGREGEAGRPRGPGVEMTIEVRRWRGWDSLVVIPSAAGVQVDDRWLVQGREEALEQEVVRVRAGGLDLILSEVGPRRAPSPRWGVMVALAAVVAAGMAVLYRFAP
jgi:hypothetical protein